MKNASQISEGHFVAVRKAPILPYLVFLDLRSRICKALIYNAKLRKFLKTPKMLITKFSINSVSN